LRRSHFSFVCFPVVCSFAKIATFPVFIGNLYGTTIADGAYGYGAVFKLTNSSEGWTYTSLHDFTGGSDGSYPYSNLIFDNNGNIFGAASSGGALGTGVVFEIMP
jgi:uncharacterized repeat protein (TIGR03803 family)